MATTSDITQCGNFDHTLERKMESLDINETVAPAKPDNLRKMTLRKRVPQKNVEDKRRVKIKPQKRLTADPDNSSVNLNEIYLSKKIKRLAPNLETIFEEPKMSNTNEILYTELKKKRRFIVFDPSNQRKIKKRQQKIKKLLGVGRPDFKKKRSSMDLLLKKLCNVE